MSYEKVKCITRKKKEGKIFITSACNNLRPLTYSRWEFREDEQDYHEKELRLLRGINGGGLVLNDSCYDWNYALYKTNADIRAKYRDYDLYELSTMKYTTYCLGEPFDSMSVPITQDDIKNGDYVLEWKSKDGKTELYYSAEEYNKELARTHEVLEKYYELFMQFLEEKHDGKYYLYSKTYGNIVPKGTQGSFYYNVFEGNMKIYDNYKQAYCMKEIIGRDVEVRAVPRREYEPTDEQVAESKKRMELLGIEPRFSDKLYMSDRYYIREVKDSEMDLIKAINNFEKDYNAYVYHIIYTKSNFGNLYNMLYVSNHTEEWKADRKDLQSKECYAYVYNKSDEVCSEIGLIGIEKADTNLLTRTF